MGTDARKLKMHYLKKRPTMEEGETDMEVYEKFIKAFEPTKADLERKITYAEQERLCRHRKCRVLMSRWNLVDDYAQYFKERGRLEGKSTVKINKLLAKNVNKYKHERFYTDEQIKEFRERDWALRKKDNLMWLEAQQRNKNIAKENTAPPTNQMDSAEFDESANDNRDQFQKYYVVNTESISLGSQSLRLDTQTQGDVPIFCSEEAYEDFNARFTSTQKSQPHAI